MQRPAGVTAVSVLFFLAAGYLFLLAGIMLVRAGAVSMILGAPLLHGLELAGPYMFLLAAAGGAGPQFQEPSALMPKSKPFGEIGVEFYD